MTTQYSLRILWLGGIFPEKEMLETAAVSPAANRWQSGLLTALSGNGCAVRILGHQPEPAWPRGRLRMRKKERMAPLHGVAHIPQTLVGYWNLPRLREWLLVRQHVCAFRGILASGFRPDCVLCYNVYDHSVAIAREAKRLGIPWVPVVADASGDPAAYGRLERQLRQAAGCVFLSWSSFLRWNGTPKLHLDGGVTVAPERELDTPPANAPKVILYTGVLNQYGGIDLLLDAFALIRDPDARLWICGKGENRKLRQMLQGDSRIIFFGCVPEEKLRALSRQAWVMVNPRPTHVPGNENNFPSKVLEYLAYGKPVVSTMTPGIAPEYAPLLRVPTEETQLPLAQCLCGVLEWSREQRAEHATTVCHFLASQKTWNQQASRLNEFVRGITPRNDPA